MGLTMEQNEIINNICKKYHVLKECALGTTNCPLYAVCSLPNTAFGKTMEDIGAEFDRQIWALAEHVVLSANESGSHNEENKDIINAKEDETLVKTITNGYRLNDALQSVVKRFETKSKELLSPKEIEFFYYGDCLVMTSVTLANNNYGHFQISANRVSFNGHSCTADERKDFESLTWNDELFEGKLFAETEKMEEMKNE